MQASAASATPTRSSSCRPPAAASQFRVREPARPRFVGFPRVERPDGPKSASRLVVHGVLARGSAAGERGPHIGSVFRSHRAGGIRKTNSGLRAELSFVRPNYQREFWIPDAAPVLIDSWRSTLVCSHLVARTRFSGDTACECARPRAAPSGCRQNGQPARATPPRGFSPSPNPSRIGRGVQGRSPTPPEEGGESRNSCYFGQTFSPVAASVSVIASTGHTWAA